MSESEIVYGPRPTPGELLDCALEHLEGATAENFQEKIEAATNCIHGAKGWLDSTVLICGETNVNPSVLEDPGPDHPAAMEQATSENQEAIRREQIRADSDRALRESKGIPSSAYPKIITMSREELQRRKP
jgi:hypothetical protein